MSHELRTPLNSVLGYAQLLRGQPGLSDRQNKALATIQQSGEHLLGLIDDILDTAKIEAGTLELRTADFDLDRLLEGIAVLPPASAHTPTSVPEERVVIGVEGDKRRVLVVDDEENGRDLLRDLLAPLGFEVHEARDGHEAVQAVARLRPGPDAILMDIRMPGLDGLTATRQIRAGAHTKDTVIIAVSASAFEDNRARCLEAGADDFLPKPFRQGRLLELLSQHLGLKLRYLSEDEQSPSPFSQPPSELILPPAEELRVLLDLARRGDIRSLLRQANHLEGLGEAYKPFAARLRDLAQAYEIKKLRHWLTSLDGTP